MKHEPELDKTVGYVLRKFPVLSETFILNEILALEARGLPIHIFSLQRPNDPRFHEDLHKLKASISYVPDRSKLTSLWRYRGRVGRRYTKDYSRTFRYALKRASPGLFWRFLQSCYIADQTRRCRIGHFHAHFATRPATVAFLASSITNIPFSFTAHAMDIYKAQISHSALAKKIEKAKFVVTISDYNVAFLEKILNGRPANIVRLYNGIDLSRFCPQDGRRTPPFKLICVARLVAKKGHSVLIEACAQLRDRGLEFECWLVGKGMLRSPIGKLIRQHKLQKHVRLLGPHTQLEVLDRYRSAHLYVLPCVVGPDGNRDG